LKLAFAAYLVFLFVMGCVSAPEVELLPGLSDLPDREVRDEEKAFLAWYIANFTWNVYFKTDSAEDPLLRDAVVRMARRAPGLVFTEDRGTDAGVYIEIDAVSEGESRKENHYGTALVRCTVIEPLTGVRLGVFENKAPRTFSKVSQFDAKASAMQAVLPGMIKDAAVQTRNFLLDLYSEGLLYELVVKGVKDAADFQQALAARVRTLRAADKGPPEVRYTFAFFGLPEDAEEAVRQAAAGAGMDGLKSLGREGRRLVFGYD
jgi:hypothetical protein